MAAGPRDGQGGADGAAPVRVLVCDDTKELRTLLRWALEREPGIEIVAEAVDSAEAARVAADLAPEVVLLDLDMPGDGPAALLTSVHDAAPAAAIVTFSGHEPELVAPDVAAVVALHVPKTTDLPDVRRAVLELGLARRRS
jgi:DNA-binding NarL/FixJ family response regulator